MTQISAKKASSLILAVFVVLLMVLVPIIIMAQQPDEYNSNRVEQFIQDMMYRMPYSCQGNPHSEEWWEEFETNVRMPGNPLHYYLEDFDYLVQFTLANFPVYGVDSEVLDGLLKNTREAIEDFFYVNGFIYAMLVVEHLIEPIYQLSDSVHFFMVSPQSAYGEGYQSGGVSVFEAMGATVITLPSTGIAVVYGLPLGGTGWCATVLRNNSKSVSPVAENAQKPAIFSSGEDCFSLIPL